MNKNKAIPFITFLVGIGTGLLFKTTSPTPPEIETTPITPEISIVRLQSIIDDQLHLEISGPARIIWSDQYSHEGDGQHSIPVGQIPNQNDLELTQFPYLGNAKTKKFYPSTSYPARGTEVKYRRFFDSKTSALEAGFVASKLVK